MKKFGLISTLACLMLAACNLPLGGPSSAKTPPPDQVQTQVQALLTSLPSATVEPTSLQPTRASSSTISATLTPRMATSTPAPSLTPAPGDPRTTLGTPVWKNTFDTGKGFALETPYEDGNVRFAVENGMLTMTGLAANGWHSWRLTPPKTQDFYLEESAHTRDCSGNDIYGLVIRAPDFDSGRGYYFGVTCDGRFNFGKWEDQGIVDIISLTQSADILSGSNQTNRLGIKAEGSHITLYANGKMMQELDDTAFADSGYFGVWVAANKTAGFSVDVDELAYWKLR